MQNFLQSTIAVPAEKHFCCKNSLSIVHLMIVSSEADGYLDLLITQAMPSASPSEISTHGGGGGGGSGIGKIGRLAAGSQIY